MGLDFATNDIAGRTIAKSRWTRAKPILRNIVGPGGHPNRALSGRAWKLARSRGPGIRRRVANKTQVAREECEASSLPEGPEAAGSVGFRGHPRAEWAVTVDVTAHGRGNPMILLGCVGVSGDRRKHLEHGPNTDAHVCSQISRPIPAPIA
jgi:hypothetical protein